MTTCTHNNNNTHSAELALQALAYLLAQDSLRDRFLALTGLTPDGLRASLQSTALHRAILGFFVDHEPDLLALAAALNIEAEEIASVWHGLNGPGAEVSI